MKVKFCGITNLEDAKMCLAHGADALGFIFYPQSPRCVSIEKAASIIEDIDTKVELYGVFVDEDLADVVEIVKQTGINVIQLHGSESATYCNELKSLAKIVKVFFPKDETILDEMKKYNVDGFLIDVPFADKLNGTEKEHDVNLVKEILKVYPNCIYSGGITVDNIEKVLKYISPMMIDIARGSEMSPGKKDYAKVEAIMSMVSRWRK